MKEGILHKLLISVSILLITSFVGWTTWVTCNIFAIEDVKICAAKNETNIEKEADKRQNQINERMNKQDQKLDKQDQKLDSIYMLLINMKNKQDAEK